MSDFMSVHIPYKEDFIVQALCLDEIIRVYEYSSRGVAGILPTPHELVDLLSSIFQLTCIYAYTDADGTV